MNQNHHHSHRQGIRIESNYVVDAARRRKPAQAAAMRWLLNYAQLTSTEVEMLDLPGLTIREINEALTFAFADAALVARFTAAVDVLRAQFEGAMEIERASQANPFRPGSSLHDGFGPIAPTQVSRTIERALQKVLEKGALAEIIGLTRIGKTTPAARWFLHHLDSAVYVVCPNATSEMDFLYAIARACGVATRESSDTCQRLRARIETAFAAGGYRVLLIDEGHNLLLRGVKAAQRLEFLRRLRDHLGVGVAILATPQFSEALAEAFQAGSRWAPGQYDGRVRTYHLPETLSDEDLGAIARHHAPDFEAALVTELIGFAKSSEGYGGAMVNAISRTREAFEDNPGRYDTEEQRLNLLREICRRQKMGRGVEIRARLAKQPTSTSSGKIVRLQRAS